ncbi:HAMP domain-containing protein [Duganella sp. BJB488]|uniref:ATP-binding protein n=1 Tax=unclassified Duganella TaxID=2636909 RepID=UPI000E35594F|nr:MULTISPECIES: ATP-binding protein [unclassified Duganella]RFP15256.1 HAMP domain-containing protein [Duganella sp. BJB489]RFP19812.1 HAMP domain-containing protein [Duganella sp. BJB488]RFP38199.1 HAMP domain-containing protein [Duganella sp. BJB480]
MRLTIARKIALAVTAIVILCVGTMAWVASSNLKRGFVAYLNELQVQDFDQLRELLEDRYRIEGNFEWLRGQPRALGDVLARMTPRSQVFEPDGDARRPRHGRRPPPPDGAPPPRGYGPARDEPPARADPPPPRRNDPLDFASRISITDAEGRRLIGPPDLPPGVERAIKVDGVVVGHMRLMPLRQTGGEDSSATVFLREQLQSILLLSVVLIGLAVLAAIWLARHLLWPVAALRDVTARLALGELSARAPLLSRDEVAELALHVNAMAEALEDSERQRRKMLADVSHELRTPLTVIRGEIEALLDGIRQADANALQSLHAEVLRLNKLVDDLHQLTMADAGDLHYHWHELNLAELLRPTLERYQPRAQKCGLDLSWSLPSAPLLLQGDAGRLQQVFTNLLENSLRYTDSGGQLVVALGSAGGHAEIVVEDSAPGVPAAVLGSIFERLYRVDGARTRERGGSGLGLAICKALVEAHGGSIVAAPSVLGGVKITVRLPLKT